jgi:6,7-dimethyl-8-ribityllumazine synthase
MLSNYNLDGVIALGCIIKGETDHDVFISNAVANGLVNVSIKHDKPIIFGVLTTNNLNQALERCGGKHGNKGLESAQSLLQVIKSCN